MNLVDSANTQTLGNLLDLTAYRHRLISTNIANIDTPGFKSLDLDFAGEMRRALESGGEVEPTPRQVPTLSERPDGNNVSVDRESLLLAENQLRFRTGVQLLRSELQKIAVAIREGR
jgi:flagellar basal-body rod protein FlgB